MAWFKKRSADAAAMEELKAEVRSMASRLDTPIESTPDGPPATTAADLDDVRDQLKALAERVDGIDDRITAISTELANQLTELSNEIETTETPDAVQERALNQVRDAQQRLANEQARYQIAFRRDLAELADRLGSV